VFSLRRRGSLLDALRAADAIAVVARSMVPRVRSLVPGARVRWIRNGIDLDDWSTLPSEVAKGTAWRAEQVPDGRRTIGLFGQLKRKKGVGLLLDALEGSGLARRFHLILVGEIEPEVEARLAERARAATPGGALTVTQLPFLDRFQLLGVLPACDVVALPSFYDGLPNVAIEAAALGIPLLASDAGGLADLVDASIGFTFAAGDTDQCREALVALDTATDDELHELGAAARRRVLDDFDAEQETAAYLQLLADRPS
jgi:glycosyltransferase involved in cell wall biosynthesis